MTYERQGTGSLDYFPCRYGESKLLFRGPKRRFIDPYAVFLGGTETYGKFIEHPFPDVLEDELGFRMINLACVNAGVDVLLSDDLVPETTRGARVTVLQVLGAHNLSNRYYRVHPRRNDRFIAANTLMQQAFPEIDFTEFAFTRHLLSTLQQRCGDRFGLLVRELQERWIDRMRLLLRRIESPICLLWMSARRPDDPPLDGEMLQPDPLFVTGEMLASLVPMIDEYVEVTAGATDPDAAQGKVFADFEAAAAEAVPGMPYHSLVAERLAPVMRRIAQV